MAIISVNLEARSAKSATVGTALVGDTALIVIVDLVDYGSRAPDQRVANSTCHSAVHSAHLP